MCEIVTQVVREAYNPWGLLEICLFLKASLCSRLAQVEMEEFPQFCFS